MTPDQPGEGLVVGSAGKLTILAKDGHLVEGLRLDCVSPLSVIMRPHVLQRAHQMSSTVTMHKLSGGVSQLT